MNTASCSFGTTQPLPEHQSESVDSKNTKTTPSAGGNQAVASTQQGISADSPYVPLPVPGCDLPISPYTCIEQATGDSSAASEPSLRADADVSRQDTVIVGGEGTKCDGYVPWSSTQPSP